MLGPLREGVVLGIRAESGELAGLLVIADDRVRDAYSHEEVALFESLAAQAGVVIQNSLVYQRMQERDRLAAIGQMAARLAHEVKNPLGAIKGAAQLLAEPSPGPPSSMPRRASFSASFWKRSIGSIGSWDRCSTTHVPPRATRPRST